MPTSTETTGLLSEQDILSPAERSRLRKVKAKVNGLPEKEADPGSFDDEFNPNPAISVLQPLPIDYKARGFSINEVASIVETLERDFEYYSRTRDLEINTPRTALLQGVVDKMTAGSGIQTRVVIMNKTSQVNAFVTPDGTVFVTQALLNRLDTLDEIAGVLGQHEVGHLVNKTHARVSHSSAAAAPGVRWVHEVASDLTRSLMEKAGYNTLEYASAIEKIGGATERDFAHQTGLMRASTSVGGHFFLDSKTAHLQPIPIEDPSDPIRSSLHKNFGKTNLEQAREILVKKVEVASARPILEKLHPQDLAIIYEELFNLRVATKATYSYLKEFNSLITERLVNLGYQPIDALLTIISIPNTRYGQYTADSYLFDPPELFMNAVQRLPGFEHEDLRQTMMRDIFTTQQRAASPTQRMLYLMSRFIYDRNLNPEGKGIPVTSESLLDALQTLNEIKFRGGSDEENRQSLVTAILVRYINGSFVDLGESQIVDIDRLTQFLTQVKDRGIAFDSNRFFGKYYVKPNNRSQDDPNGISQQILATYLEVFNINLSEETFDFQDIDQFFEGGFLNHYSDEANGVNLAKLIIKIRNHFQEEGISDEMERLKYVEYFFKKIDHTKLLNSRLILKALDGVNVRHSRDLYDEDDTENKESPVFLEAVWRFSLKTVIASTLFDEDGDGYYKAMEDSMNQLTGVMQTEGIDVNSLSKIQLVNLCANLLRTNYGGKPYYIGRTLIADVGDRHTYGRCLRPENLPRLFKLPLIKLAVEKEDSNLEAENIDQLDKKVRVYFSRFLDSSVQDWNGYSLYQDSPLGLLLGPPIAASFDRLLEKGVSIAEYGDLYTFVNRYFSSGIQKQEILRGINQQYLNSPEVQFDQKVDYLITNLDSVGYEGVCTVVDHIKDINTYRNFRQQISKKLDSYLDGTMTVTKVALADFLSSELVNNFATLLETCQIDRSQSVSTKLARQWMNKVTNKYSGGRTEYDEQSQKFIVSEDVRGTFRTVGDIFAQLRQLTPIQRFAIAHKALMDASRAFASEENRKILASVLVSALDLQPGFIADALSAAATDGDAKYIGFPASSMVSSMLFNALDLGSVDIDSLKNETEYHSFSGEVKRREDFFPGSDLETVLSSPTRDITLFGANTRKDPQSSCARLANQSDSLYYSTLGKLTALVGSSVKEKVEQSIESKLDPANEAVIKAVQASGALGVRALQLASQFHRFSPTVDRRLSEAFDANPGMDRVRFWENLNKQTVDNPEDRELEQFLQRVELGDFLGGGSLQTTFAAVLTKEDGGKRRIVIKMKNPSVLGLVGRTYQTADNILRKVSNEKANSKESRTFAETSSMLIDLSQAWCIADINDKTYVEDDDLFRQTIAGSNTTGEGELAFFAPERVFTRQAIKAEDEAEGRTVNQVLKDPAVSDETKKRLVQSMARFFLYQLRGNSFQSQDGRPYFLIHSDPHIGNYMADVQPGADPGKMGVIDRSLYLQLSQKEVRTLEKLISNSNSSDFVYSFIDLILDENKDRGIERVKTTARVFLGLAKEYRSQIISGKVNKIVLLQTLLAEFTKQKKEIPLRLRLMIRNIGALQELTDRYGLDLAKL